MASSFSFVDELIRDYLNYRGLTNTLRTFDNEQAKLTIGSFRADRIVEQLTLYVHQFDLPNLIDYWTQIEQRFLSTLIVHSQQQNYFLTKLRTNLYRCYLIHAIQSSKTDKIHEFFERLAKTLQQSNDWTKEWFALPFLRNPDENSTLQLYFSKQWNDLFWISLQNFLSTAFY
jgi:WD repeat-containing protein 91